MFKKGDVVVCISPSYIPSNPNNKQRLTFGTLYIVSDSYKKGDDPEYVDLIKDNRDDGPSIGWLCSRFVLHRRKPKMRRVSK